MNYTFYLRQNFTSQLQKSSHDTSAINLVDFIFYFKEKAKYLAMNLNVAMNLQKSVNRLKFDIFKIRVSATQIYKFNFKFERKKLRRSIVR